jgi:hypothetical protein
MLVLAENPNSPPTCRDYHVHMACLDELLNCLVDQAAEAALDGHVHNCWLDVVLGHPFQALCAETTQQHTAAASNAYANSASRRTSMKNLELSSEHTAYTALDHAAAHTLSRADS